MKLLSKFLVILLSICLICVTACSCSSANKNAVIYYEAPTIPHTLDPQIASSDTELTMIRNLFEGLMRIDKDGELALGVATDYTYKNSTYTFYISETAVWSDGASVTADDFVFAFKRAVDPATKSPYAAKLSGILNADLIISGTIGPENLGVSAKDSKTLSIIMGKDDVNFLYTLTTSVCMPCREDFFNECKGQYGLSKSYILTNGSYKLTKWNTEDFAVRMHRSDKYFGNYAAQNSAVFMANNPDTTNIEKLSKSSVDIANISMSELDEAATHNLNTQQNQNIVWVMEVSSNLSKELRESLFLSFNRSVYTEDLSLGFAVAKTFFPASITNENLDNVGIPNYNITDAKELFTKALENYPEKKLPVTTLIYYNVPEMQLPINNIVGHWQNNLGAYINIQPSNSINDIKSSLNTGTSSIAIYPITINDSDPAVFCHHLGYDYSRSAVKDLSAIQGNIISQYTLMPVAFENSVISYSEEIIDFNYKLGNGMIDFAYVTKK